MADEMIRLSQFLKVIGAVDTGGEAKVLIQDGHVMVNGQVETRRKRQLHHGDRVTVGGQVWVVEFEPESGAGQDGQETA